MEAMMVVFLVLVLKGSGGCGDDNGFSFRAVGRVGVCVAFVVGGAVMLLEGYFCSGGLAATVGVMVMLCVMLVIVCV